MNRHTLTTRDQIVTDLSFFFCSFQASKLTHLRFFSAIVITYMFQLNKRDRLYCCLPLCHSESWLVYDMSRP